MTLDEFKGVCNKCGYVLSSTGKDKYVIYRNNKRESYMDLIASYNTYDNRLTCYIDKNGIDSVSEFFNPPVSPDEFFRRLIVYTKLEKEKKKRQRLEKIDEL